LLKLEVLIIKEKMFSCGKVLEEKYQEMFGQVDISGDKILVKNR